MRCLYIHGMNDTVQSGQLESMRSCNLEVYALHLDYGLGNEFETLANYCETMKIEFLVGHSYGGFLSYWLGEHLGIPCLNINPLLSVRLKKKMQPPIKQRKCPICLTVVGENDEIVDPVQTLKHLSTEENSPKIMKTKLLKGCGHVLSQELFEEQIAWAIDEIKT